MAVQPIVRVLIVDESALLRRDVRRAISRTGVSGIYDFDHGADALSVLPAIQPAILVIGHQLEEMSGLQLSRSIRANTDFQHMPLILLSPVGQLEDLMEAVDNGIDAYVVLPFEPVHLAQQVRNAFSRIRSGVRPPPLPPETETESKSTSAPAGGANKGYAHRPDVSKEP